MVIEEFYALIDEMDLENTDDREKLIKHVSALHTIIQKQNESILEFRNNYIRLENTIRAVEGRVEYYSTYKRLCEIILERINTSPIRALWFLYSVRKKITEFNKES